MPRHRGHGLLKAVRAVSQPDRHRTSSRPNPWPRCPVCFHRVPNLCGECITRCLTCCLGHDDEENT